VDGSGNVNATNLGVSGGVVSPIVVGGSAASSALTLESTSGTGTSDSIVFKTGSQATQWTIDTSGNLIGTASTAASSSSTGALRTAGGLGVAGKIYAGGGLYAGNDSFAAGVGKIYVKTGAGATGLTITAADAGSGSSYDFGFFDTQGQTLVANPHGTHDVIIGAVQGHIRTNAVSPPALTSCGTSPSISGTDVAGQVTMGTGSPTGCVITFQIAYASAPYCNVSWQSNLASMQYTISPTAITLAQTAASSNKINYHCTAQSGG
jgi:hypothetical protein